MSTCFRYSTPICNYFPYHLIIKFRFYIGKCRFFWQCLIRAAPFPAYGNRSGYFYATVALKMLLLLPPISLLLIFQPSVSSIFPYLVLVHRNRHGYCSSAAIPPESSVAAAGDNYQQTALL